MLVQRLLLGLVLVATLGGAVVCSRKGSTGSEIRLAEPHAQQLRAYLYEPQRGRALAVVLLKRGSYDRNWRELAPWLSNAGIATLGLELSQPETEREKQLSAIRAAIRRAGTDPDRPLDLTRIVVLSADEGPGALALAYAANNPAVKTLILLGPAARSGTQQVLADAAACAAPALVLSTTGADDLLGGANEIFEALSSARKEKVQLVGDLSNMSLLFKTGKIWPDPSIRFDYYETMPFNKAVEKVEAFDDYVVMNNVLSRLTANLSK